MRIIVTVEDGKVMPLSTAKEPTEEYALPYDLDDVSVAQASMICEYLTEHAAADYLEFISGKKAMPQALWSSQLRDNALCVAGAISAITGIPEDAFKALPLQELLSITDSFESGVVLPIFNIGAIKPNGIDSFTFEGVTYLLPKSEPDGAGDVNPMAYTTTEEYCEALDLQVVMSQIARGDAYKLMPLMVAILCRPEGEPYDEIRAKRRAEKFVDLPVSVAIEVFFYLLRSAIISLPSMYGSLTEAIRRVKSQLKATM